MLELFLIKLTVTYAILFDDELILDFVSDQ